MVEGCTLAAECQRTSTSTGLVMAKSGEVFRLYAGTATSSDERMSRLEAPVLNLYVPAFTIHEEDEQGYLWLSKCPECRRANIRTLTRNEKGTG